MSSPSPSPPAAAASPSTDVPITYTQATPVPLSGPDGIHVEVDEDEEVPTGGHDSSISTGNSTATTSLSSSIFSFTYANGRRYHSDRFNRANYFLPNDENEQERLDLLHHIFLLLLGGKLYTAPLENLSNGVQKVLDVGTGTGIWAIDFADENPQAEVIGTDISPIQPNWVPPNCKFEVEDMEETWTFPNNEFDYIHMRGMSGSFADWHWVLKQALSKLKPGAYLEFQDYSCEVYLATGQLLDTVDPAHPITTYFHHVNSAAESMGRPTRIARFMKGKLERAGFVDVEERTAVWPVAPWPKDKRLKELGRWSGIASAESLFPFAVRLLTEKGWAVEDVRKLCDEVQVSLAKNQYYALGWFVHARKPDPDDKKKGRAR
ncbi:S-adenosyl-L-methionine-dependent methyltransferase [Kalaharituber pfeilii]|nr:S-adenosyl-L-methionine-dependent methyltransferase [Kalaharituber pfeilii]